jgi:hypothetical protein
MNRFLKDYVPQESTLPSWSFVASSVFDLQAGNR